MGGKASRDKGYRAENELRHFLLDRDIYAKRQPLSGGAPGFPGDILAPDIFDKPIEVKDRENNPKRLWEWLEGNDALFLKRNRYPWLAIMTAEGLIELWKKAGVSMLVKYVCPSCGKGQLCLIRDDDIPDEMECPQCGAMAERTFPKIKTHYKSPGFTKHVEREENNDE